jgi:hypothetical protein
MGKEKILSKRIKSYLDIGPPKLAAMGLTLAAFTAGCGANRPDHFAGPLQPLSGTCDPPGRGALVLNGSHVLFTPREGIVTLDGALAPDGSITASATSTGMDHTPYRQTFAGNLAGDRVTGTLTTPRCRYSVDLAATR